MKFRNLNRYRVGGSGAKMDLSIPIPTTPDGRVYRYSPNPNAHPRHFVLGNRVPEFAITDGARKRMKLEPGSKQTVCPYSGTIAADSEFMHPDDVKAALDIVRDAAARDLQEAMRNAFRGLNNRSSGGGFLRMSMEFKEGPDKPRPRFARRDLLRELVCDHCGRDYGVFAISLLCPDCGAPNLRLHFAREVDLVRQQVELATEKSGSGSELAYRLLGNAHEDVLTAFEATQKAVYLYGKVQAGVPLADVRPVGTDFQKVHVAPRRFAELGIDPFSCLEPQALDDLKLNVQKRHILGHNLGVMDEKFAAHDGSARIGETVRLVAGDVIAFAESCQRIVSVLDEWLTGSQEAAAAIQANEQALAPEVEVMNASVAEQPLNLAERVGRWLASQSEDARMDPVMWAAVASGFADEAEEQLEEAVAELEADGYVSLTHFIGSKPAIRPTIDLFVNFDQPAIGSDPLADAATLTERVLAGEDTVDVPALHAASGLSLRRFNAAISLVIAEVDDRRVSQEISSEYPSRWFMLMPSDRVGLKRFLKRAGGD